MRVIRVIQYVAHGCYQTALHISIVVRPRGTDVIDWITTRTCHHGARHNVAQLPHIDSTMRTRDGHRQCATVRVRMSVRATPVLHSHVADNGNHHSWDVSRSILTHCMLVRIAASINGCITSPHRCCGLNGALYHNGTT